MRVKNSIRNFSAGLGTMLIANLLNFISRTVFINILGRTYLGVNGLLSNILSMLSLAELGVSTAINFSLYKPIANKDQNKISILMNFYRKTYRVIGIFVFFIGLVLMLFLDYFVKTPIEVVNLRLIFLIYLINTSYSYFMTYKITLLNADQKEYILAPINITFNILTVVFQIIILLITNNYIAYLLSNMIILFIQRLYINRKINIMYPFLREKEEGKLSSKEFNEIKKNVKAMMFHKIGDYCINGTDNIIISVFINVEAVGIYSNYSMIIMMINNILVMLFNSMTASMGNLIATESNKKKEEVFSVINFIGFWFFGFASICLYNLLNPFIEIWVGKGYLLGQFIVAIFVLNFYFTGMRIPVSTVKMAAGVYNEDKFTPFYQAVINLIISIFLVKKIGLVGVFIGTLISSIAIPCWQRPYIVYKYVFKSSIKVYYNKYFKYLLTVVITTISISLIFKKVFISVSMISFSLRILICLIIPNVVFLLLFRECDEFKTLVDIINGITGGKFNWIKRLV